MKSTLAIVNRVYEKRVTEKSNWSGRIGAVEFAIDAPAKGELTFRLNGKELPAQSATYLMTFALQCFQDAYAGADSLDDATASFDKKVTAVIEGTMGQRGEGLSDEVKIGRQFALAAWQKKHGKDATRTDEELDAIMAKNAAAFKIMIDAEIARRAAARAEKARLAAEVGAIEL